MKRNKQTTWELYAKTIRLRVAEKRVLRERIISYMQYHPMRVPLAEATPHLAGTHIVSESFTTIRFGSWQFRVLTGVFAVFLMIGVPVFAERAVPGDVLYLMKVNVNEEVLSSLTWDGAGKIAWEAERVERRIAEARLLALEGKLTEATEAQLAETVREHTENASRELEELRATDAEGAEVAQAALASTLDVQTAILATDAASSTTSLALAQTILEVKQGVSAHDPSLDDALSSEKLNALLENETTRARELFASISKSISEDERISFERRLIDIERTISDARIMHETGRRAQALSLQRATFGDIQKLIEFMSNIDVRTTVSLDQLVPVRFTDEERIATVSADLEDIKNQLVALRKKKEQNSNPDVEAKYEDGVTELSTLIIMIEDARSAGDASAASVHITTARTLLTDLMALLDIPEVIPNVEEPVIPSETEATTTSTTTVDA